MITTVKDAMNAARRARPSAACDSADRTLTRRAAEIDFAVASTIDRFRVRVLRPRRGVQELTRRLESHIQVLDEMSQTLPPEAAKDLEARKGQATWLLTELRRSI